MAQPIRKTPTLKGKEAEKFISDMLKTENRAITKTEKEFVSLISG